MILEQMEFAQPWFLLLLLSIPALIYWHLKKRHLYNPEINISTIQGFALEQSWKVKYRPILWCLQLLAIASLIIALARPQKVLKKETVETEGIDIMLALDVSSSMLSKDFDPNRLEASKRVAQDFIDQRKDDRIGLVVFAGESFTQCPLTTDHNILKQFIQNLNYGLIDDGTAIGMGLANAVNRLKDSPAKSKICILLTDGVNSLGYATPLQAADAAKQLAVKVYTIGVGSEGRALAPVNRRLDGSFNFAWAEVQIDEDLLKKISKETGGQYFRAVDIEALEKIYQEINRLETSKIETLSFKRYKDEFHPFALLALICLLIAFVLKNSLFKSLV